MLKRKSPPDALAPRDPDPQALGEVPGKQLRPLDEHPQIGYHGRMRSAKNRVGPEVTEPPWWERRSAGADRVRDALAPLAGVLILAILFFCGVVLSAGDRLRRTLRR